MIFLWLLELILKFLWRISGAIISKKIIFYFIKGKPLMQDLIQAG
jgi:hypothetical protein